jgi:hypothetical protein
MKAIIHLCCVLLLGLPFAAQAENKMYGIYSTMRNVEGEISGFEMLILHNGKPGKCSDSVLFQVAEGWPQNPELLDCCGCSTQHIEFVSTKWGKFIGRISNDTLSGEFVDARHTITLPKGQSFWQQY